MTTRYVIVTTEYRGVYFGEFDEEYARTAEPGSRECVLKNARMAIYWGTTKGVDQLAATGPTDKSRLGATAPKVWLCGITSIVDCTPEAVERWHAAP